MITVPTDIAVTFSHAIVPMETPVGIMDGCCPTVEFGGKTYHVIEQLDSYSQCLDVETGEIITLDFNEFYDCSNS